MKQQPLLQKRSYRVFVQPVMVPATPTYEKTTPTPAVAGDKAIPPIQLTRERIQLAVLRSQPRQKAISAVDRSETLAWAAVYST
jgi:hypothetical protein